MAAWPGHEVHNGSYYDGVTRLCCNPGPPVSALTVERCTRDEDEDESPAQCKHKPSSGVVFELCCSPPTLAEVSADNQSGVQAA